LKKLFLISAALLAAISSVQSADLPRTYTKAPAAPTANWTGWYAGVNFGYGFNDPTVTIIPADAVSTAIGAKPIPASYNVDGVLGGAQIGYNWQLSPNWLVGLEADFQGSNIKGSGSATEPVNTFATLGQQKLEWFGTVRARVGILATEKLLAYATGGFAYGSVNDNALITSTAGFGAAINNNSFNCPGGGAVCFAGSRTKVQTGYTAGAGLEYAAWQNVSVKMEYLYVNLGSGDVTTTALAVLAPGDVPGKFNAHFSDLDFHVVRVGANWRF
jgi:outer membrane immunogenic protein